MKLKELLERLTYTLAGSRNEDIEIAGIEQDSRKVSQGSLFVAVRGTNVDGHTFIPQCVEAGASAIVCDEEWWAANASAINKTAHTCREDNPHGRHAAQPDE